MHDEGLFIPLDVLEEATSDIPLALPGGAKTGKLTEPVTVLGSQVSHPEKLAGKTIVEVTFKVAENGTPVNATRQFRHSFFLTDASLSSKALIAADTGTRINLRLLTELTRALGLAVDGSLIKNFANFNPALLNGSAILMKATVKEDNTGTIRFNVSAFAPVK